MEKLQVRKIILASGSPYRRDLLAKAGVAFEVQTAPVDERSIQSADPIELSIKRSVLKATAVAMQNPDSLVIGADQVLGFRGRSFDKVDTAAAARDVLEELSGQTHILSSAYCLIFKGQAENVPRILEAKSVDATMHMRDLSEGEIAAYIATGEWQGSVGCYKLEGAGIQLFRGAIPDAFTVIGLPLTELFASFRGLGLNPLENKDGPWTLRVDAL